MKWPIYWAYGFRPGARRDPEFKNELEEPRGRDVLGDVHG